MLMHVHEGGNESDRGQKDVFVLGILSALLVIALFRMEKNKGCQTNENLARHDGLL